MAIPTTCMLPAAAHTHNYALPYLFLIISSVAAFNALHSSQVVVNGVERRSEAEDEEGDDLGSEKGLVGDVGGDRAGVSAVQIDVSDLRPSTSTSAH